MVGIIKTVRLVLFARFLRFLKNQPKMGILHKIGVSVNSCWVSILIKPPIARISLLKTLALVSTKRVTRESVALETNSLMLTLTCKFTVLAVLILGVIVTVKSADSIFLLRVVVPPVLPDASSRRSRDS